MPAWRGRETRSRRKKVRIVPIFIHPPGPRLGQTVANYNIAVIKSFPRGRPRKRKAREETAPPGFRTLPRLAKTDYLRRGLTDSITLKICLTSHRSSTLSGYMLFSEWMVMVWFSTSWSMIRFTMIPSL